MTVDGVTGSLEREAHTLSRDARRLPDFLIIGAMKCGTTSLYRHLGKHPDIGLSKDKETDFFLSERNFAQGFEWYAEQFRGCPASARVLGEASPNYSKCNEFPGVAERIARHLPEARLIYMVRDPVERFISQYLHHANAGEIDLPPGKILQSPVGRHYLDCSRYHQQVAEYLRFFPRERLLVVSFDELHRDPQVLLRRVFAFLRVDATVFIGGLGEVHNRGADLQRLPAWYFTARRSPLLRRVKQGLPPGVQRALVTGIRRSAKRRLPEVRGELRQAVRSALAEDVARFRDLTGQPFAGWCV